VKRARIALVAVALRFRKAGRGTLRVARTRSGARLLRRHRHVRLRVSHSLNADREAVQGHRPTLTRRALRANAAIGPSGPGKCVAGVVCSICGPSNVVR
jgi:hypothetical protein